MNKTKTIYFLSAIVFIIGCYALNLSYSLFVQTEEKEVVNATVPYLAYNLETSSYTIPASSEQIITLNINNTGTADINYGILLDSTNLSDNVTIQLVDLEENDIIGNVTTNTTKTVKLYVSNTSDTEQILNFTLEANYKTLNFNNDKYTTDTKIDRTNKFQLLLSNQILTYDDRITRNETTPTFTGVATEEEGIYKAEDDYGDSWYFRGSQPNNYVNFAGFTWRIVRINGDNSVRLILDGTLDKVYRQNEDGTISDTSAGPTSAFNDSGDNAYIGYMYGTPGSDNYDDTHKNENDSKIKTVVDTFYETYIESDTNNYHYEHYLSDALFCGDKSLAPSSIAGSSSLGYGTNNTAYASASRLYYSSGWTSVTTAMPTLECAKNADNTYSRYTSILDTSTVTSKGIKINNDLNHPIALLTADEVIMAGGWRQTENTYYYLHDAYKDKKSNNYWRTMSSTTNNALFASSFDNTLYHTGIYNSIGVRPVINLKSEVVINSGDGTVTSPYELKEITAS